MSVDIRIGGRSLVRGWAIALAIALAGLAPWTSPASADEGDFLDVSERYFPIRHGGITVIADRLGSLADEVVEHFEPHQLQYLGYCGADPICPQDARDAGAVYYASISVDGEEALAFYDEDGNLVGISRLSSAESVASGSVAGSSGESGDGSADGQASSGNLVGSLGGDFNVSGSVNYSIPLEVPPAFGGLEPQLSLTYDSNGGNGALGVGWQIAGIDNITRCSRNIALDGRSRAVQLNGNDRFCLKGKRLVAVDGAYGDDGTIYRTRIASFVRVESRGQAGGGPQSFKVTTKAGETLYFGDSADSRVTDGSGAVLTWSLRRVVDAAGNVMLVNYENTDHGHRPTSIEYSEVNPGAGDFVHRVVFEWEDEPRPDVSTGYVAGMERAVSRRLEGIRTESNGQRVRRYGFTYRTSESSKRSLLTSIQLCGTTAEAEDCLPATTIDWQDPDREVSSLFTNRTRIDDNWNSRNKDPVFFDYDGDGDTDILLIPQGGVYSREPCCPGGSDVLELNSIKLLTNNGGSFSAQDANDWFNTNAIGEEFAGTPDPIIRPVDFDGDGRQELAIFGIPYMGPEYSCGRGVTCRDRKSRAIVVDWDGSEFNDTGVTGNSSPEGKLIALDTNGDGRQALLSLPERYCPSGGNTCEGANATDDWAEAPSRLFRYTGSGWASHGLGSQESILNPEPSFLNDSDVSITPLDTDGDQVTELLVRHQGGSSYLLTPAPDGKSFNHDNVSNHWGMGEGSWYPNRRNAIALDFNGDGNQDLLMQRKGTNGSSTFLLLSNGKSFQNRMNITDLWGMSGSAWNGDNRVAMPNDFNGDGMDDLLLQGVDGQGSLLLVSEGNRVRRHDVSEAWGMNQSSWGAEKRAAYIMDYDGDAVSELVLHAHGDRSSWLMRDSNNDPSDSIADRVTSITEGDLEQYTVEYELAGLSDAYTPASNGAWSYPQRSLQNGFVIATRSSRRNGIGGWRSTEHEYHDLRVHQKGHGVLGFGRTIEADPAANRETVTDMHNTDPRLVGMVERTRARVDGELIREVTNEYQFADNQPDGVHFPFLQRSIKNKYELDGTHLATVTTENSGYDAWGNVGRVTVSTEDHIHGRTWRQITDNTWDQSTPETGRLLTSQVTHEHPDGSSMVRRSAFEYDPATGILISETVQPGEGAGLEQTTSYDLDRWGNKAVTTVSGTSPNAAGLPVHLQDWPDRVTSRTTEIDLASGLRKVTITNAMGHSELRNYRLSDGALDSQEGPNGLPTGFEHDPLGRRTRTILPDGTEATINRQWGGHPEIAQSVYHITEAETGQPSVTTWYDRLGRELGTTKPGLDGRTVIEFKEYNARGAVARSARPHYLGETLHWIEFSYDARGRVIERSFPLGDAAGGGRGSIVTSYSGYETHVTDAEGRTTIKERNARDQLVKATDAMGESVTYAYNAVGDLVETIDPLGRSTTFVYDVRGRKVGMTAPDMGTWSYVYNSFGELIAQTDAKGQTVHVDYDALGRKIRRDEPEGVTRWCYDGDTDCGSVDGGYGAAIGKLVGVTGPELDYRKTIEYDDKGRPERRITWHLGDEIETYPVATTYDDKGRVDSTVYPEGFTVYNDYNQQGYLVRKLAPRDTMSSEIDGALVEAERLARMIARYEAKAADFTSHASLYERMANDYAASGDSVMAARLDDAADELRGLAANLDQAVLDAQAELDQLETESTVDAETLRVRYGPDGEYPEGQDPESAAARAAAEAWLEAAEEHLARAEQVGPDDPIDLRDQELALAQNALAMARAAADEADVPEPGEDPALAESVPQGSTASECSSTEYYEVFWCAESADAEGRINKLHYGNGLVTHRDYESASGQLAGIRTEVMGDAGIILRQDLAYQYDRSNNVTRRDNQVTRITQDYAYDANDRLTQADVSLDPFDEGTQTSSYTWSYDALGNRVSDTRVGTYAYDDPANPGRLTEAGGDLLSYDTNGNVTAYSGKVLTWSSFNKPTEIQAGGTTVTFTYGADRSRYRRHEVMPDGTTKTTRYLGKAYERTLTVAPGGSTTTEDRYFIHAAGRLVAIHTENRTDNQARNRFLHRDALGTVTLITDALGQVVERYAFRPFGERAVIEPPGDLPGWTIPPGVTPRLKRGFTGHEHIEGVGLIHMNGRVYDPRLGRFLSADPNVQFLDQPRGYNRYVYAQNNPLKYTDPSGYFLSVFVAWAFQAIVTNYIQHQLIGAFVTGFLTGLLLSGGDVEAGLKSGVVATGFSAVGDYAAQRAAEHPAVGGGDAAWASGGWKKVVAHATVGGASSEIAGGRFRDGFAGAGFTQMVAPGIGDIRGDYAAVPRTVAAAVIGGTGSALSGGTFANGAETAAFLQSTGEAAEYFQHSVGGDPTLLPGENREDPFYAPDYKTGRQRAADHGMNVFGPNKSGHICSQGSICSRAGNVFPGGNNLARVHDYWLNARKAADLNVTLFHNVGTMLPAAAVGYGAIIGQVLQPLNSQQLIYLSVSTSFDRYDDRSYIYGAAAVGAK